MSLLYSYKFYKRNAYSDKLVLVLIKKRLANNIRILKIILMCMRFESFIPNILLEK